MLAMLLGGSASEAQTVVNQNTASGTNKLTGTATINGQIVNVTAIIDKVTNAKNGGTNYATQTTYNFTNIGYRASDGSGVTTSNFPQTGSALGVSTDNDWFFINHNIYGFPSKITFRFDRDVVISTFGISDLQQVLTLTGNNQGTAWSANFTLTGYNFDSAAPSYIEQATSDHMITTAGVDFKNTDARSN